MELNNLENSLKDFFSERTAPSMEVKAALARKLADAQNAKNSVTEKKRAFRNSLFILFYAAIFSVSILGFAWVLFGAGIFVLAVGVYLTTTVIGGLGIAMALKDGGEINAVFVD